MEKYGIDRQISDENVMRHGKDVIVSWTTKARIQTHTHNISYLLSHLGLILPDSHRMF